MIRQETLEKRAAKVSEMIDELKRLVMAEDVPDRVRVLIGNHQIEVRRVLMGYRRIT